jgi:hypothetical protein
MLEHGGRGSLIHDIHPYLESLSGNGHREGLRIAPRIHRGPVGRHIGRHGQTQRFGERAVELNPLDVQLMKHVVLRIRRQIALLHFRDQCGSFSHAGRERGRADLGRHSREPGHRVLHSGVDAA